MTTTMMAVREDDDDDGQDGPRQAERSQEEIKMSQDISQDGPR